MMITMLHTQTQVIRKQLFTGKIQTQSNFLTQTVFLSGALEEARDTYEEKKYKA